MAKDGSLRKSTLSKIFTILVVLIIAGLAGAGGYYYKKHRDLKAQNDQLSSQLGTATKELEVYKTNPQEASKAETARIVEEVGKVYDLPKEAPDNVYTVQDKEAAKKDPFFAKAENGDITLIYSGAKLAILYRPSTKQIINSSTVTIQNSDSSTSPNP